MDSDEGQVWPRRDGKGKLSARSMRRYRNAGITREEYLSGRQLSYVIMSQNVYRLSGTHQYRFSRDTKGWTREELEKTIRLQWSVIENLERKLANDKRQGQRRSASTSPGRPATL